MESLIVSELGSCGHLNGISLLEHQNTSVLSIPRSGTPTASPRSDGEYRGLPRLRLGVTRRWTSDSPHHRITISGLPLPTSDFQPPTSGLPSPVPGL